MDGTHYFTAVIEEMAGSVQMETEYWQEVTNPEQASRIARRFGFDHAEPDGIGGWMIEVTAEDQLQALQERGFLIIGGNDATVPYRIRIEMP